MELSLDRLTKHYGSKIAVDCVSATLRPGVYGLLGENGAGKTTLMKMLCAILESTSGEVLLNGKEITSMGADYRNVLGYLPQDFGYYPNYTAMEFLMYVAALKGIPKKIAKKRAKELLEVVGLSRVANKKVKTFSGGMKQRVGIVQALLNNPQILILDEPINGLDPKNIVALRNLLQKLNEEKNITIFISSHILSELYLLATDYIFIHKGKIIDVITHDELEARCRKYICIKTDAVPMALTVLDKIMDNPEYKVVSEDTIHLYSDMDNIEKISRAFMQHEIVIMELSVMEQTLEDYFMGITGGVSHV